MKTLKYYFTCNAIYLTSLNLDIISLFKSFIVDDTKKLAFKYKKIKKFMISVFFKLFSCLFIK